MIDRRHSHVSHCIPQNAHGHVLLRVVSGSSSLVAKGSSSTASTAVARLSIVTVRGLKGLHLEGSAQALAAAFPTCWDVEVLTPGANDTEPGDIFARYVWLIDIEGRGVVLCHEDAD